MIEPLCRRNSGKRRPSELLKLITTVTVLVFTLDAQGQVVEPVDSIQATTASHPPDSLSKATDSIPAPLDTASNEKKMVEYIAYPFLQLVVWPADKIIVPSVKLLLYPTKPPLRYMINENVLDRTIKLISFGNDKAVMIYPTLNLAPGTGSYTGVTLRHLALFGRPTEKMVGQANIYVNGDWKFRSYFVASDMFGSGFTSKTALQLTRVKNTSVNQPGTEGASYLYYADTANAYSFTLSHLLFEKFGMKASMYYRDNHFGEAPTQKYPLTSNFFKDEQGNINLKSRGLESSWTDKNPSIGIFRDSRNNNNVPLTGSTFNAVYHYHFTDAQHDFQGWEGEWTGYFKLGGEKFEISSEEERKSGGLSMKALLKKMEYENVKKGIFNRKVLVTHVFVAQVSEVPGNRMPVYGLRTLGNDTPMRGYSGSRFRDYAVLSGSAEYRFPVMRLVDGVVFNEYGIYGRSLDKFNDLDNLRNSWGFGIRVRRPDIYLFRAQFGFHGMNGIQLNMSVDEPF